MATDRIMAQEARRLAVLESRGLSTLMFLLLPIIIHSIMSRHYLEVRVPHHPWWVVNTYLYIKGEQFFPIILSENVLYEKREY